ncbi:MAG: Type-2 restriction enzyme BglI [Nitrospira sp.]|nr:Type-2 restriction enzyme BglI [Nitrospira sp.]
MPPLYATKSKSLAKVKCWCQTLPMFGVHREEQFVRYQQGRATLVANPKILIGLEQFFMAELEALLLAHSGEIRADFDEASFLYPFWQNYPPDDRGRSPIGDQFPWIEVGEHAIGRKLSRLLSERFTVRDTGIPTGTDERLVLSSEEILRRTDGLTNQAWLFVDIKSVGPRDDQDHAVMSHNQVSGDGQWTDINEGVRNTVVKAVGVHTSHDFHCSIPPLYVRSDGTLVPVVVIAIKPVYRMIEAASGGRCEGQPLLRIDLAAIPNGLLLLENPGYLKQFPRLLFPGKDDKGKDVRKLRARVSWEVLRSIAAWRVRTLTV